MYSQEYLTVGFVDGVIEVWNKNTLEIATTGCFDFQSEGKFMGHNCHILFLEFSENGKVLASGDSEGTIKVWNFSKGKCVKKLEKAHTEHGITCIRFNEGLSIVYSSSFDKVIKSHGLKSASLLKEFKGHSGPVSEFHLMEDQDRMISASGDGTLRIWNLVSTACVKIINPLSLNKKEEDLMDVAIMNIQRYPNLKDKECKHWCLV
jgi:WD40 repeat-containing protein SMU1